MICQNSMHTNDYLKLIGVSELPRLRSLYAGEPPGAKLTPDGHSESIHGLLDSCQ
jgi:hypothetical protein